MNTIRLDRASVARFAKRALHAWAIFLLVATAGTQAEAPSDGAMAHAVRLAFSDTGPIHPAATPGQSLTQLPDGRWLAVGGNDHPRDVILEYAAGSQIAKLPFQLAQGRSGHTATLLPDGSILVFGGFDAAGRTLESAERIDVAARTISSLAPTALLARANHTATVLSDGRVLFAGGTGKSGEALLQAELYDPDSNEVEPLDAQVDHARLQHIAAMLADSSVMLWGGVDRAGRELADGSIFNPGSNGFSPVNESQAFKVAQELSNATPPQIVESRPAQNAQSVSVAKPLMLHFSKRMAVTSLNSDTVTLIGPNSVTPIKVVPVENGMLLFVTPEQDMQPAASYTLFINGATDSAGRVLPFTAIGFTTETLGSSPSAPGKKTSGSTGSQSNNSSATAATAAKSSQQQKGPIKAAASSPLAGLGPYATILYPKSVLDLFSALEEARAVHESLVASIDNSDEEWTPGGRNYKGDWRSGRGRWGQYHPPLNDAVNRAVYGNPEIAAKMQSLKPGTVATGLLAKITPAKALKAERGITAVSGQVLRMNSRPLANVTLSIGSRNTRTDANGEFTLDHVSAGHQVLVIDGATASQAGRQYGRYEYGMDVAANQVNALPFVIWMTRLDTRDAMNIPSPTASPVVLTNPKIPGLELHIPAGTVIRDAQGKIVTQISMTAIPTDQPPFPLPNVPVPTYFTIQPGGAHLEGVNGSVTHGAQLIYPNFTHSAPGTRITFWNYDPTQKGWYVYGQGTVSKDGVHIVPDSGVVIYDFSGAMVGVPGGAPGNGPNPSGEPHCGDPVDCATGLFLNDETDLSIPDIIPAVISRSYRPQDNASRGFGIGTNLSYDMFLVGDTNPYTYTDLVMPDGSRIHFPRISAGTGWTDAVYQNTSVPGRFFGAVLKWDSSTGYAWTLTLKDGTVYSFADEAGSTSARACAVRAINDRFGNALTLSRDGNSNLTQITTPNGRHVNLTYDTGNRVTQVSDDVGRTVIYGYDTPGRLVSVTDPAGNVEKYTYDSGNNMLTVVDKRGNTKVTNTYDVNGRVSLQTYADGSTMKFTYTLNANGAVTNTSVTDGRGIVYNTAFNANSYPISSVKAAGQTQQQTISYNVDPNTNLLTSVTDALNRSTHYSYDALGNVTQLTYLYGTANAVSLSVTYDPAYSRPTRYTDLNGYVTTFSYDSVGNLLQVSDPLGHAIGYTYDSQGRALTRTDANNNTTTYTYFGADLTSITDAIGRRTQLTTDTEGNFVGVTNPLQAQTVYTYSLLDQIKSVTDPNNSVVQFTYDPNGNQLTHVDADHNPTSYTFDPMDRIKTMTDGLSKSESYAYDGNGNFIQVIDRKGQLSGWSYDPLNRVSQVGFGATSAAPSAFTNTVGYTWDAGDRLTQIVDSVAGTITRAYDGLDNLTQETTPQGSVAYTYDAGGRRSTMTVGGQPAVTYTWDNANRLTKIQQAAGASNGNVAQTVAFQYDNGNRRTQTTLPNGIVVAYGYDNADELTSITYTQSGGTQLGTLTYGYDLAGHRISEGGTLANVNLPAAVASATYNANNQIATWSGTAYSFDLDGNLLSDGVQNYSWNARNQLASITGLNAAGFSYDGVGRRVGKTVNGASTAYLYDGDNFVQQLSGLGAGASVTANLLTGDTDQTFARMTSTGITTLLLDAIGSTVAETNLSQAVTANYGYEPYGKSTATGNVSGNTQQYAGRENEGTNLYYNRARYYAPSNGRFTAEDPIGWTSGQPNNYAYVGEDPIDFTDPSGLINVCVGGLVCSPDLGGPGGTLTLNHKGGPSGTSSATYNWPPKPPKNPLKGPPIPLPKCFPNCGDHPIPLPPRYPASCPVPGPHA